MRAGGVRKDVGVAGGVCDLCNVHTGTRTLPRHYVARASLTDDLDAGPDQKIRNPCH